jgi:hypothetical protein
MREIVVVYPQKNDLEAVKKLPESVWIKVLSELHPFIFEWILKISDVVKKSLTLSLFSLSKIDLFRIAVYCEEEKHE